MPPALKFPVQPWPQVGVAVHRVRKGVFIDHILVAGALAFGLAFGMGTREIVRNIVTGFYVLKVLVVGKAVDVAAQSGILTAITATHATHATLESDGRDIIIANSYFLEQTSKQARKNIRAGSMSEPSGENEGYNGATFVLPRLAA
jgi:hypothetical protein